MRNQVGTQGWASSEGRLRRRDRIQLVGKALLTRLSLLPVKLRARLGLSDTEVARMSYDL